MCPVTSTLDALLLVVEFHHLCVHVRPHLGHAVSRSTAKGPALPQAPSHGQHTSVRATSSHQKKSATPQAMRIVWILTQSLEHTIITCTILCQIHQSVDSICPQSTNRQPTPEEDATTGKQELNSTRGKMTVDFSLSRHLRQQQGKSFSCGSMTEVPPEIERPGLAVPHDE